MKKNPLVVSGPSGVGKSTLCKQLELHGFKNVLMTLTRPPREGEVRGVDFEFLSSEEYEATAQDGKFFMDNRFFGKAYGIRKAAVEDVFAAGRIPMVQIYLPVVDQFLQEYPESETVFMLPESREFLAARLATRGQSEEEFNMRFTAGVDEVRKYQDEYRHLYKHELIISDNNNAPLIERIRSIYESETRIEGAHRGGKER